MSKQYFRSIIIPFKTGEINKTYELILPSGTLKNIQILSSGIHAKANSKARIYKVNLDNILENPLYIHSTDNYMFKDIFDGFIFSSPNITNKILNASLTSLELDVNENPGALEDLNLILYVLFIYE